MADCLERPVFGDQGWIEKARPKPLKKWRVEIVKSGVYEVDADTEDDAKYSALGDFNYEEEEIHIWEITPPQPPMNDYPELFPGIV